MEANTNTVAQPMEIPTLASMPVSTAVAHPGFAAFKSEDRISFVRQYDPKAQVIESFRHAVIRYRTTEKNVASKPAQMVTIPSLVLPELEIEEDAEGNVTYKAGYALPDVAAKVLLGLLEDAQDNLIRSLIDSGSKTVGWDIVNLASVFADITAIRVSKRLTKEQIEAWVVPALGKVLEQRADQISTAKSFSEEQKLKQRAGTVNAYKANFAKLAAPVPNIGENEANALLNMLRLANLGDDLSKVLAEKLNAILHPVVLENGDL